MRIAAFAGSAREFRAYLTGIKTACMAGAAKAVRHEHQLVAAAINPTAA